MLNKSVMMGRLTRDVELKVTSSGKNMVSFSIACERDRKVDDKKETDFFNCMAFGKTAELISKYFSKGRPILVVGRMQIDKWQDKNGIQRQTPVLMVSDCYFCDSKPAGSNTNTPSDAVASPSVRSSQPSPTATTDIDELAANLPF